MKRNVVFFLLIIFTFSLKGQNYITALEYWADTNYNTHVNLPVIPQQQLTFSTPLSFPGLSKGMHSYNIRFQQSNGFWSQTSSGYFIKTGESGTSNELILAYRYWTSGDDSIVTVALPSAINPLSLFIPIDLSWAHKGNNYLYFQFRDLQGNWSVATLDSFYKSSIPVAAFTAIDTLICFYDSVHFVNNSNDGDVYMWHFGDGDSSTAFEPVHFYQQTGSYNVSLTVTDTTTGSDSTIFFNNYIHVVLGDSASFTYIQNGLQFNFTNTSLYANSYYWDFGDNSYSSLPNPSHSYLHDGNYTITFTTTDSCGTSTDTQYVSIILSDQDLFIEKSITILQENDNVKILFNSNYDFCVYKLTSITGQILQGCKKENIVPGYVESFSLDGLAEGIYYLQIWNEEKSFTKLLLKVN